MSKRLIAIIAVLAGFLLGIGILWIINANNTTTPTSFVTASGSDLNTDGDKLDQFDLINLSMTAIEYIRDEDFESLADLVHPEYNLIFSPYATINLATDKYFTSEEVREFGTDKTVYTWGAFDGSSEAIEMTVEDYYGMFVFDRDYSLAPMISVDNIIESGNALENVEDIFPQAQFVEFHFPTDEAGGNYNWSTLRLVFEKYNDTYALTAIIHSGWTA